jgi:phosphate transport system substrate-binding protein
VRPLAAFAASCLIAACAGDPPPPEGPAPPARPPLPAASGQVRLAGSGAATPLVREALALLRPRTPETSWVLEDSVGSAGGVAAVADGAVDVGLVSRALNDSERSLGLEVATVATDAVVVAAHPDVGVDGLSSDQLRALYAGAVRTWPEGAHASVLLRDRGESANAVLERAVPGLTASRKEGTHFRVLFHDAAMVEALASTPGALGVSSLALLTGAQARLKVLALDGLRPDARALEAGTWPATRPISLVFRPERRDAVAPLLRLLRSDEGAGLARRTGYRPERGGAP